jgi:hypothetical protein
MYKAS